MRKRGRIWLGDLAMALAHLQPSPEAREAIARVLGLSAAATSEAPIEAKTAAAVKPPAARPSRAEPAPAAEPPPFAPDAIPFDVIPGERAGRTPVALASVKPLEQGDPEDTLSPPPLDPLFRPGWTRALLSGALSTDGGAGAIDYRRLTEMASSLRPVEQLPRLPVATLRRGIQVLVDQGEGMQPFLGDQEQMLAALDQVIGRDKVTALGFAGTPLRGAGAGARWDWRAYQPPPPGAPVLLLTDLGIQRGRYTSDSADASEWLAFLDVLRHAGNPAVAFVPYSPERWPGRLAGALKIIPWDRGTTISAVRKAIGRTLSEER